MKLVLALFSLVASGQTFEVATVKPAVPGGALGRIPAEILNGPGGEQIRFGGGPGTSTPNRIDYVGVTLKSLLQRSYDVKADQVSGPDWIEDERYDIVATMAPGTNAEQLRLMLQQLTMERFQISMHRETKTMRVYLLTVAKGGSKLKPPQKIQVYPDDEEGKAARTKQMRERLQEMIARREATGPFSTFSLASSTVAKFVQTLSSHVDRPVVDRTGLDGLYSFALDWVPDSARARANAPLTGPSIYVAVEEQLGLHLEPENQQTEILVIDKAEKVPTSN
jgi:uncharacterized protein (TIGR03435 family)